MKSQNLLVTDLDLIDEAFADGLLVGESLLHFLVSLSKHVAAFIGTSDLRGPLRAFFKASLLMLRRSTLNRAIASVGKTTDHIDGLFVALKDVGAGFTVKFTQAINDFVSTWHVDFLKSGL